MTLTFNFIHFPFFIILIFILLQLKVFHPVLQFWVKKKVLEYFLLFILKKFCFFLFALFSIDLWFIFIHFHEFHDACNNFYFFLMFSLRFNQNDHHHLSASVFIVTRKIQRNMKWNKLSTIYCIRYMKCQIKFHNHHELTVHVNEQGQNNQSVIYTRW